MKYRLNPNYSKIVVIAQTSPTEMRGTCPGVEGELHANATDAFQSATGTLKLDVRRFATSDKIRRGIHRRVARPASAAAGYSKEGDGNTSQMDQELDEAVATGR